MIKVNPDSSVVRTDGTLYLQATADSTSDLSGLTTMDGYKISFGSLCLVGATGDFYYFASNNTWKKVGS